LLITNSFKLTASNKSPGLRVKIKGNFFNNSAGVKNNEGGKNLNQMADVKALAEGLVALTVKEVQELADFLKSEYGIEPAAAAVVVSAGGDGGGAAAAEEKTAFNVVLKSGGASKLNVVKIVKELTGLGLKEAKDLVDGAPKNIKEGVSKAEADEIANKLKEAGADVEIA
jgi:large subunit ribosomal protein L7/L12